MRKSSYVFKYEDEDSEVLYTVKQTDMTIDELEDHIKYFLSAASWGRRTLSRVDLTEDEE